VRWIGHWMRAEVTVTVDPGLTVAASHEIATRVEHSLRRAVQMLAAAAVHVDPAPGHDQTHHHGEAMHTDRTRHRHD
jgi:divalent metal cation (Fe/Co/Zn/Cd) transporter